MNTYLISIGDWSADGHEQCRYFTFKTDIPLKELQDAYRKSCQTSGLAFDHDTFGYDDPNNICCEYEEYQIGAYHLMMLERAFGNLPLALEDDEKADGACLEPEEFAELILWFCKQSLPSFTYTAFKEKSNRSKTEQPAFNGWWGDLNVQFGYGLFE
jgi:hypothetical protein